jgi:hypothetical protein
VQSTTPPRPSHTGIPKTRAAGTAKGRELGEELRRLRTQRGLNSVETANLVGWTLGRLSKLEGEHAVRPPGTSAWPSAP